MYVFLYGTFKRASTNNLDSVTNSTYHAGEGAAPTNATDSSIAHTSWKKRKQIKVKAGTREKPDRMSWNTIKSKVGVKLARLFNAVHFLDIPQCRYLHNAILKFPSTIWLHSKFYQLVTMTGVFFLLLLCKPDCHTK